MRGAAGGGGGFDPTEEFLVDPEFQNAAIWDSLGGGDVNTTFPDELYVHDTNGPATYQGSAALTRIPPDGTYRLTYPAADHVTNLPTGVTQVQCGKGAVTNVPGSIAVGAFVAGGTFDFVLAGATTKRFGAKFNGGGALNFALPRLSLKRIV